MSKLLNITIADKVFNDINNIIKKEKMRNKSEFCEELLRLGLIYYKKS